MAHLAEEKGLKVTVELDEELPKIHFDKDKIIQVLTNLVSNAIKFTEKGSIHIRSKKDKKNSSVTVSIMDTGLGIGKEDLPKVFGAFEQLGGISGRKPGGTGLGLTISKEIVERHNGKIWVESQTGKGTTFYFMLFV